MTQDTHLPKYPVIKKDFAARLELLRKNKKLTMQEIAEEKLGIDRKTYRAWENPDHAALPRNLNTFILLCEVLGTTPLFLATGLFGEQKEERHSQVYLDIYDRYRNDLDFHFVVASMMKANRKIVHLIAELIEELDEAYQGTHPILKD